MKVLHVYSGNLFGGVETLLVTLAQQRSLCPQMQPHFALCFEGRLAEEIRATGLDVHRLGEVRFSQPWTVWRARQRLCQVIQKTLPDAVICHECWAHCLAGPVVRQRRLPLVFWMHGLAISNRWYEGLARRTPPDLVLVNSHYTAKTLPARFPGQTGYVIYVPVAPPPILTNPPTARTRVREELETGQDAAVILMTSRMTPYKGHLLLLEALGRLQTLPGWILWMTGAPQQPIEHDYFVKLKATASEIGISEQVRFLGERSDVASLLMASDIHCQPNIGPEPFGITFIEALYAGLPVVSTQIGGAVEIITQSCGVLVPPDDPVALAEALAGLIKDPDVRSQLGAAGPERARQLCEPVKILGQLQEVLANVTHKQLVGL